MNSNQDKKILKRDFDYVINLSHLFIRGDLMIRVSNVCVNLLKFEFFYQ